MNTDDCAQVASRAILSLTRQGLPSEIMLMRINTVVLDAIKAATPPVLPELYPGQDGKVQQALAVIDAARLRRLDRERAANDRRQGNERRVSAKDCEPCKEVDSYMESRAKNAIRDNY